MPTLAEEFAAFWAVYPRKVSRQDAMKAYQKARIVATAEEILAGVQAYLQHLPEEMRYVPYAASWLNAGRWQDEYEPLAIPKAVDFDWYRECALLHQGACNGRMGHYIRMRTDEFKAVQSCCDSARTADAVATTVGEGTALPSRKEKLPIERGKADAS